MILDLLKKFIARLKNQRNFGSSFCVNMIQKISYGGIEKLRKRGVFNFENFTCAENLVLLEKRGGDYLRALAVALNALP